VDSLGADMSAPLKRRHPAALHDASEVLCLIFGLYYHPNWAYFLEGSIKSMSIMFAWGLGGWEVVLILVAILIIFGAKKLPELAKGLGTGIKEFKKATREVTEEIQNAAEDKPQPQNKSASDAKLPPPQTVSQSSNPPKI